MPRPLRNDRPGVIYHVTNRGVARRSIFESRGDFRFFLAQVARAVRAQQFTLLAYALMGTHYHLIVRSHGGLSDGMQKVQYRHARRFNRRRDRDGPLFGRRFFAKAIQSHAYLRNAFRYVHENPVLAGLAQTESEYAWSSGAWSSARPSRRPRWLAAELLDRYGPLSTPSMKVLKARADLIGAGLRASNASVVSDPPSNEGQSLYAWLRRRAELADGVVLVEPAIGPRTLLRMIERTPEALEDVAVPGGRTRRITELLAPGLLRSTAGCSLAEVTRRLGTSRQYARTALAQHRRCLRDLQAYGKVATTVVRQCLDLTRDL